MLKSCFVKFFSVDYKPQEWDGDGFALWAGEVGCGSYYSRISSIHALNHLFLLFVSYTL